MTRVDVNPKWARMIISERGIYICLKIVAEI